jgi:hypothetical protein
VVSFAEWVLAEALPHPVDMAAKKYKQPMRLTTPTKRLGADALLVGSKLPLIVTLQYRWAHLSLKLVRPRCLTCHPSANLWSKPNGLLMHAIDLIGIFTFVID